MKILMVMTSHDKLGDTGKKTGFWLEEFAAPYYTFLDAGAAVTVASPKGGEPPLDPKSDLPRGGHFAAFEQPELFVAAQRPARTVT
jgi:putative intracellular protease/amidase